MAWSGPVLELTASGLYCAAGDFYIDPWKPVPRAVITHAHSDHARWGCERYLAAADSELLLRHRLGAEIQLTTLSYGERLSLGEVAVSLHPAGHVLGSSQVRLERNGYVAVVSGDYKREVDATCAPWESLRCHLFVTESTFGLPIFTWQPTSSLRNAINAWWQENQQLGRTSILYGYALGKSQRLLAMLEPDIGPIFIHGALQKPTEAYRAAGVSLPVTRLVSEAERGEDWSRAIVLAVPSAHGTPWLNRFKERSTSLASGWMQVRGNRRRRSIDRGFVLSDHVDWPHLIRTVRETEAEQVWVTHGFADVVARYLTAEGVPATPLATSFVGESLDEPAEESA